MSKALSDAPFGLPQPAARRRLGHKPAVFLILLILVFSMYLTGAVNRGLRSSLFAPCHRGHRNVSTVVKRTFTLPSGDVVPGLALGVWKSKPGEVGRAVETALKVGYTHIDGAWIYRNEAEVGAAIVRSGVSRKDLWITSKLWNTFHKPTDVESALDDSLSKLGTDYVDLYLVHWPVSQNKDGSIDTELTENPFPTWQLSAMERLVAKGKVRNIGVSNFNVRRLTNLTSNPDIKIIPAVNQVELNFWNPQPELVAWSKANGIVLEAYSPLGSDNQVKESLNVPEVLEVAEALDITPAQVVLSWQAQRGVIVLAKSVTPSRIAENLQLFELPQEHFNKLETAATAHPPKRIVNPSKGWGVDIFDEWATEAKL